MGSAPDLEEWTAKSRRTCVGWGQQELGAESHPATGT
eukprot:CAMPEP_0204552766 /NCGR_PEP_ID=MMETSP0661-20131031/26852_1 /ASSEMBLY_ACC=CAM_ASM_000606 /TAXON_ID=109239 /ORGANISM="Alexandrium margalefi, Strain AMGDE01CS-322" /LENGTH=36 /DNA_ID= /DNA_START= /DNA_END= /DNA_ORIENTATION=